MLKDKVVVITGGAGLIGKEFVKAVAENKAVAVIADINEDLGLKALNTVKQELSSKLQGRYGNIINIASIYGVIPPRFEIYKDTNMTVPVEYAAIKSALIHLTKYMAKYFKGMNIRVNAISPGGILDNQPESFLKAYNSYGLTKGMLNPEDLTGTLIYLLSDMSKYVNGQNIVVDDGWSL